MNYRSADAPRGEETRADAPRAQAPAAAAPPRFVLFSRPDCGLCEEMLIALRSVPAAQGIGIEVVDVDAFPEARERYGHKIPVLTLAGELVCRGRLDIDEVHKALAAQR